MNKNLINFGNLKYGISIINQSMNLLKEFTKIIKNMIVNL